MGFLKDILKKLLPPSKKEFNREMKALKEELSKQTGELYQIINVQLEALQTIQHTLDNMQKQVGDLLIKVEKQISSDIEDVRVILAQTDDRQRLEIRAGIDEVQGSVKAIRDETAHIVGQIAREAQSIRDRQGESEWQIKNEMWRYSRLLQVLSFYKAASENGVGYIRARERAFKMLPKAEGAQRHLQLMECLLLKQFKRICEENGLQYWISDGTLLGAIRHDGFVPWDDDMDVSMPREDFNKLRVLLSRSETFQIVDYYRVQDRRWFSKISKFIDASSDTSVFIDVFPYDRYDAESIEEARAKYWDHRIALADDLEALIPQLKQPYCDVMIADPEDKAALDAVFQKHVDQLGKCGRWMGWSIEIWDSEARIGFPEEYVLPCGTHRFETLMVHVPRQAEKYLEQVYGEYMLFPLDIGYQNHTRMFGLDKQDEAVTAYLKKQGVLEAEEGKVPI